MSSTIKVETGAGTALSVIHANSRDDCLHHAKAKTLLSVVHALKEATYLTAGILALLFLYSFVCELDLADQEFNRSHQTTFKERS